MSDNSFEPRKADDRIGYFTTIFQDYTNTLQETQYVRYINKWNLIKNLNTIPGNQEYTSTNKLPTVPGSRTTTVLTEPVEPIIFWIENTVPEEFRLAIREGVLAWNIAFENIGFKNAVVVKQMPDDATWDPGDVRYNTIRWFVQPGSAYAVGPSRANPITGEIYDADIRISADFVRAFYSEYDEFITPVIIDNPIAFWNDEDTHHESSHQCLYAENLKNQMIFSWQSMIANGIIEENKNNLKDYVHKGLVDLVLHEVGHTLGLRHNFKASSIFTVEQLSDPSFTEKYGISGSVMDYHSVSLLDNGHTMFQTKPGPYDIWAIEYGYIDEPHLDQNSLLNNIASQSNNPYLVYGTDEDASGRSIDPLTSRRDMTSEPIRFYENQIKIANKYWDELLVNFEKEGDRYPKLRSVFWAGMSEYYGASRNIPKFIGGIYHSRHHVGGKLTHK